MSMIGFPFIRDPFARDFENLLNAQLNVLSNAEGRNDRSSSVPYGGPFIPRMDLSESDQGYILHTDVPGVKKNELDINVKENVLTISGERTSNKEIKEEQRHLVERSYGKFSRSLRLPNDADADRVAASMENGVLQLVFPKKPLDAGVKKISIE
ncbi:hypothetical protein HDU83_004645 [Entophlyctis luteolus]|nr:hypothetical protein HDU82_007517 [Entophlyctis luteolus]KAJ3354730.1 hypothetical protein HDU83_004645 [Entophlyctis luteolus]